MLLLPVLSSEARVTLPPIDRLAAAGFFLTSSRMTPLVLTRALALVPMPSVPLSTVTWPLSPVVSPVRFSVPEPARVRPPVPVIAEPMVLVLLAMTMASPEPKASVPPLIAAEPSMITPAIEALPPTVTALPPVMVRVLPFCTCSA